MMGELSLFLSKANLSIDWKQQQCDEMVRWELSWTGWATRSHVAHVVDAADELGTVLFGYTKCSYRGSEYFYSSRAIDMDGRGSPLITADKLNSLEVCGCVAPLETQLGMFNCVDNCIILVVYIRHQVLWGQRWRPFFIVSPILPFLFIVTYWYYHCMMWESYIYFTGEQLKTLTDPYI